MINPRNVVKWMQNLVEKARISSGRNSGALIDEVTLEPLIFFFEKVLEIVSRIRFLLYGAEL